MGPVPNNQQPRRLGGLNIAADFLGVSTKTVRRMIASGELTGYRVGKRLIRVDLDEVDALARQIPTTKVG